jgi:hypothetical protein
VRFHPRIDWATLGNHERTPAIDEPRAFSPPVEVRGAKMAIRDDFT